MTATMLTPPSLPLSHARALCARPVTAASSWRLWLATRRWRALCDSELENAFVFTTMKILCLQKKLRT